MDKCDVCGNVTFHRKTVEEVFNIDGHRVLVEDIPARVCDRCGDATFDRKAAEKVRRMVHGEKRPSRHVNVDVFAYA